MSSSKVWNAFFTATDTAGVKHKPKTQRLRTFFNRVTCILSQKKSFGDKIVIPESNVLYVMNCLRFMPR